MNLIEIRGKKANKNRWNALKTLDWEKDFQIIEKIFCIKNPLFFSSRTTEEIIAWVKEQLEIERIIRNYNKTHFGGEK